MHNALSNSVMRALLMLLTQRTIWIVVVEK